MNFFCKQQSSGSDPRSESPQRIVAAEPSSPNEEALERALRPKQLDEYVKKQVTDYREQAKAFGLAK